MLQKKKGRYLGLDIGDKRIGIAISDEDAIIAQPLKFISTSPIKDTMSELTNLKEQYQLQGLVIGLPLNMQGKDSAQTLKVRTCAEQIKTALDLPIYFQDERLSTVSAEKLLSGSKNKIKRNKGNIDIVSAAIILQTFLDKLIN